MAITVRALASGSSGNAILVRAGETALLIDAGLPGTRLKGMLRAQGVMPGQLAGILITHEHSDHIAGAAVLARHYGAPIIANRATLACIDAPRAATAALPTGETQLIGGVSVTSFPIPHDAREPVGYALACEGWRMAVATDVGYDCPDIEPHLAAADLVVLEANHDTATLRAGPYPWPLKSRILGNGGHLSNDQAARLLERAFRPGRDRDRDRTPGRRRWLWLAHLSEENNTPRKAREQVGLRLDLAGVMRGLEIDVARRDAPSAAWHSHMMAGQLALF